MSWFRFDDIEATLGTKKAREMFEAFKKNPPNTQISPDFAMQIIARLIHWYVKIEKIEWGLENPDSDSNLEWCEHYFLKLPQINAKLFLEVGSNHYYASLETVNGNKVDETVRHWEDIVEFIHEQIGEKHA
jgi:hypothetical protein